MAESAPLPALGSTEFWHRLETEPARLAYEITLIDLVNLEVTMQHQPALKAWVVAAFESARIEEESTKWRLNKAKAQATIDAAAQLDHGKKKTVAEIGAIVELDENVKRLEQELLAAERKRVALRAMVDGLNDRRDMLVQIAARQRDEAKEY